MLLSSRFHSDRVASLVVPLLLAMSGSYAAASLSGTETTLVALTFIGLPFVVRTVLVPCMRSRGGWLNWWPSPMPYPVIDSTRAKSQAEGEQAFLDNISYA